MFAGANVAGADQVVRRVLADSTPRASVILNLVTLIPRKYPFMPLVGLGPGQFWSRAALLASGLYLGKGNKSLPFIPAQSSQAFREYLAPLVTKARKPGFRSSPTVEPFFSCLTVYTEFWLPCLIGIFGSAIVFLLRVQRGSMKKTSAC